MKIVEVKTKAQRKQFVDFQFRLYRNNAFWVPPLKGDELKAIDASQNPAFENCDARFWYIEQEGQVVGRIGAIIHYDYNKKTGVAYGRINRMEFIDDEKVSTALFDLAEDWFRQKKMTDIHGPLGFSNLDTQGLLIEGFDYLPSIGSVYHHEYYLRHFEKYGFKKENDWVEFRLKLTEAPVKKAQRGADLIKRRFGFEMLSFTSKAEMQPYAEPIFKVLNEAFQDLPYVSRFSDKMIQLYSEKYFKVLDPNFVKIVLKDQQIVGFLVAVPSLSKAMQKAKGKLFPMGFYHLYKALKNPSELDLLLTGVEPEFQSSGVAVILFSEIQQEMLKRNLEYMETTGVFETNHNVIANWKNFEHIQHKRRRCFCKSL